MAKKIIVFVRFDRLDDKGNHEFFFVETSGEKLDNDCAIVYMKPVYESLSMDVKGNNYRVTHLLTGLLVCGAKTKKVALEAYERLKPRLTNIMESPALRRKSDELTKHIEEIYKNAN